MSRSVIANRGTTTREMVGRIKSTVDDPELVGRRRDQITASAIAEFIRLGYHSCTIKDVAKHADVSVGLIYQYFGDKEDLLFLALVEILEAYRRQIPPAIEGVSDPLPRFCKIVETYCKVHSESPDATVLAYRETASLRKERRNVIKQMEIETNQTIKDSIKECIAAGLFHQGFDEDIFCYQIVMFSHTWALKSWTLRSLMSFETYYEHGIKLLLASVTTTKGAQKLRAIAAKWVA